MDIGDYKEAGAILESQWGVAPPGNFGEGQAWEILLDALAERILDLMQNDNAKLMRALYVLDIYESSYKRAMSEKTPEKSARALARAVLDRETEKIASRKKYARKDLLANESGE